MPGTSVPFALRLHNPDQTAQTVTLRPVGELAEFTAFDVQSFELQPDGSIEVPTVISLPLSLPPGTHSSEIAVSVGDIDVATAEVTVNVETSAAYAVSIAPATVEVLVEGSPPDRGREPGQRARRRHRRGHHR